MLGPAVVMDLRAGPAGAGVAHLPEVVLFPQAMDAGRRHADLLLPDAERLVVVAENGDPQPLRRQVEVPRQQLPGVGDGLFLEVVAEGEVAQHFEERVVKIGAADLVEVVVLARDAHALLDGDRPAVFALFLLQEDALELVHAGVGEQQGGVLGRHQGRGEDALVPLLLEELVEGAADIGVGGSSVDFQQVVVARSCPPASCPGRRRRSPTCVSPSPPWTCPWRSARRSSSA